MLNYVVITPAHNEELFLERTIQSVAAQTHKPLRWVIVDDGSADRTREIAARAASGLDFVRVVTIERKGNRTFGNKAAAFNSGLPTLGGLSFDLIGNLDADISFGSDYFSNLIRAFEEDDRLGIAGGIIFTRIGSQFVTHDKTPDSVAGAVQLFRRKCFEDMGGRYLPLPYGGIDAAAEIIAKARGWKVKKDPNNKVYEHRQTGTAGGTTPLAACLRLGRRFHSLGYGMIFYIFRCLYRISDEPMFLGSCAQLLGFVESIVKQRRVQLPREVVQHLRGDQRRKLRQLFSCRTGGDTSSQIADNNS